VTILVHFLGSDLAKEHFWTSRPLGAQLQVYMTWMTWHIVGGSWLLFADIDEILVGWYIEAVYSSETC
jgi:hypothetical protein